MSKATERKERLLPNGTPRYVRCYDDGGTNGGTNYDRFTIVFTGNFKGRNGRCNYIGCSENPFHPQGVGQHGESETSIDTPAYSHLGKKVKFETLPEKVKELVLSDYMEYWGIEIIKDYYEQYVIGTVKHLVNYHNGISTHKDGSKFYDIKTFTNKKNLELFIKDLVKQGYKEKGISI